MDVLFAYIRGILFIGSFVILITSLGNRIIKEKNFPLAFITGYVVYTCLQALVGIFIQVFHFDRIYYYIIIISAWCIYIGLNYKRLSQYKHYIKLLENHLRKYILLYFLALLFTFFAITNIEGLWTGNQLDDGAYLSQIGQSLNLRGLYDVNTATGYSTPYDFIRLVNTFEIEASLYATLFQIPVTIYLKCILPFLNYFLFVTCVYYLSCFLTNKNHKASLCVSACTLLFALTQSMLQTNQFLILTDDWQFNWAMGYGSSVVRVMGLILIFIPLLKNGVKINWKHFCYYIIVSIALMSKATQALPILYISALVYAFIWIHQKFTIRTQGILYSIVVILLCMVPTNVDSFEIRHDLVYLIFRDNFASHYKYIFGTIIIMIFLMQIKQFKKNYGWITLTFLCLSIYVHNVLYTAILLLIFSFTLENKNVRKWNYILLTVGCLLFVPKLNNLFVVLSIYSFVASRAITLYAITLICTCFVYLYFLIEKLHKKQVISYVVLSSIAVGFVMVYSINYSNSYGFKAALKVIGQNPYLLPQSTLDLQNQLQVIADEELSQLDVIMPIMHYVDHNIHFPYVLLRIEAEDINSVSAILRYPNIVESNPLSKYSQTDQDILEAINTMHELDRDLVNKFNDVLVRFPDIDIVVIQNSNAAFLLEENTELRIVDTVEIKNPPGNHFILQR